MEDNRSVSCRCLLHLLVVIIADTRMHALDSSHHLKWGGNQELVADKSPFTQMRRGNPWLRVATPTSPVRKPHVLFHSGVKQTAQIKSPFCCKIKIVDTKRDLAESSGFSVASHQHRKEEGEEKQAPQQIPVNKTASGSNLGEKNRISMRVVRSGAGTTAWIRSSRSLRSQRSKIVCRDCVIVRLVNCFWGVWRLFSIKQFKP